MTNIIKIISQLYNKYSNSKKYIVSTELYTNKNNYIVFVLNTLATGVALKYIFTHFNFLSLGLASSIILYYAKWFKKLHLAKTPGEVNRL